MVDLIVGYAVWFGIPGAIAGILILSWPRRRLRSFNVRRIIDSPMEKFWDTYVTEPENPFSAAVHPNAISKRVIQENPTIIEAVIDGSGGQGTHNISIRYQVLTAQKPTLNVTRPTEIDGKALPFGPDAIEMLELADAGSGVEAAITWRGETANWWQYLHIWHDVRQFMKRLKRFSELEKIEPQSSVRKFPWKSLTTSIVAIGSFAYLLGWIAALILIAIIVVHEFGHYLAMKMTGLPSPRIVLIPFLGGIAVANRPHKSKFDDAFVSLMGPAISIIPCAILVVIAAAVAPSVTNTEEWITLLQSSDRTAQYSAFIFPVVAMIGAINTLQTIPVLPLDGGQILRAVIESSSSHWARWSLIGVTVTGIAGLLYSGDLILAAILGLGGLQAWHINDHRDPARPMAGPGIAVIGIGYVVTLIVHVSATIYGIQAIGI